MGKMPGKMFAPFIQRPSNIFSRFQLKCHKYWPDDSKRYGDILVTMSRREFFSDFTIRVFKLENLSPRDEVGN